MMTPINVYDYNDLIAALRGGDEANENPTIILVQGVSGSGKSTLARHLAGDMDLVHIENEQFFIDDDGNEGYFIPDLVAHSSWYSIGRAARELNIGRKRIVVSNAFISPASLKYFFDLASVLGLDAPVLVRMGPRCRFDSGRVHSQTSMSRQIAGLRAKGGYVPQFIVQCPLFDAEYSNAN